MRKISDALSQIAEIHAHMAKGEVYRGLRPDVVASSGLVGLLGALAEPWMIPRADDVLFSAYWLMVAAIAALIGSSTAWYGYFFLDDGFSKRRARIVAGQMLPCIVAGGLLTIVFVHIGNLASFLPGIWATIYSLGLFSMRPYMPRSIGWVALYFLAAGMFLLWFAAPSPTNIPDGWPLSILFLIGQAGLGLVLYRNEQREFSDV